MKSWLVITHRLIGIHGNGLFTYIYQTNQTKHVDKYTSPMDPMGFLDPEFMAHYQHPYPNTPGPSQTIQTKLRYSELPWNSIARR